MVRMLRGICSAALALVGLGGVGLRRRGDVDVRQFPEPTRVREE